MLNRTIVYLFGILSSRAGLAFKLHEIAKCSCACLRCRGEKFFFLPLLDSLARLIIKLN